MKSWMKRHKFWTGWLAALGVMLTLIGVIDVEPLMGILALSAVCYGAYCAVRWFMTRAPDQTIPQRAVEWATTHKFWTVILAILLISVPLSVLGIVDMYGVGQLIGFTLPIYAFWWLSQRGRRRNKRDKAIT